MKNDRIRISLFLQTPYEIKDSSIYQHHKRKDNWILHISHGILTPLKMLLEYFIQLGQASRSNYQFIGTGIGGWTDKHSENHSQANSKMPTVGNPIGQMTLFLQQVNCQKKRDTGDISAKGSV